MAFLPANGRRRRPSRTAAGTLAVVLGAGLLAGCGGSSDPGPAGGENAPSGTPATTLALPADVPQTRACGLVTEAEVEAAVGAGVNPGREEAPQEARSLCSFSLTSAREQSVVLVSTSSSGVQAAFDAVQQNAASEQPIDVGDQAFVNGGMALIRKGDTMVAILVVLRRPPDQLAGVATRLARSVGAHL